MYNFRLPFIQPAFSNTNNSYRKNFNSSEFKTQYQINSEYQLCANSKPNYKQAFGQNFQKEHTSTQKSNLNNSLNEPIYSKNKCENENTRVLQPSKLDDVLFEIFGLNIYFDDVLIICILLFLYQEGIQDEYLFICLILLLLN